MSGPHHIVDGVFTLADAENAQAEGAYPKGARIVKTKWAWGDANAVGALGRVIGSIGPLPSCVGGASSSAEYGYFVEWDAYPGVPVFVRGHRIGRADS